MVEQEYKGLSLKVKAPMMICTRCGWFTVGNNQIDELIRRTKKEYAKQLKKADVEKPLTFTDPEIRRRVEAGDDCSELT